MRNKQKRLVITFPTPNDAFALEAQCRAAGIPGRLLPAPVELTGGCGIGWTSPPSERNHLENLIDECNLKIKLISEIVF